MALIINAVTGIYVLSRGPRLLLNRLLFAVLMALVAWSAGELMMRTAGSVQEALRASKIAGFGWCLVGGFFLIFAFAFTEKYDLLQKPMLYFVVFAPGVVFLALIWTTDLIFRGFTKSYWGYREIGGTIRLLSQLYVALIFIVGIAVLFSYWRNTTSHRKRTNALYVLVASSIPVCAGLTTDVILPVFGRHVVELAMFASTAVGPLLAIAVINNGLLTTITGSLGSTIITKIREAVFVTDSGGLIETVNNAAERLLGYSRDELVETAVEKLFSPMQEMPPGWHSHTWTTCIDRSGEHIPVTVSAELVKRRTGKVVGSVLLVHDMRETLRLIEVEREAELAVAQIHAERVRSESLRRSREELMELSKFLESVMENIAEPLWIKDRGYRIVFANRAFCELSGFDKKDIIGKIGHELAPPEIADSFKDSDRYVFETGVLLETEETSISTKQGDSLVLKGLRAPLKDDDGNVQYVVGVFNDITEHRRLDKARLDFIRIAAHELRTPLTSLRLGFELLARETRGFLNA
ncbi:MAG TPA: PAS domain S-box protein, partial [Candidatus Anoxymicrobiaceae bacterium]